MAKAARVASSESVPTVTPAVAGVVSAVKELLAPLAPIEQETALTAIARLRPQNATPRAGKVLGTVVQQLEAKRAERKDWTVREIREVVADKGVKAEAREVFNAIGYLARRGRVQQIGYGRYRLLDYGVVVEDLDLDGGG
jgi:hypothetical protein